MHSPSRFSPSVPAKWLFGLLMLGTSPNATAQVAAGYAWTQNAGTYSAVGGAGANALFTDDWDDDDVTITLPFTFYYDGTARTQLTISSNGFVVFGSSVVDNNSGGAYQSTSNAQGVYLSGSAANDGFAGFNADLDEQTFSTVNGNRTNGSANITGVSNTSNLRVGMRLSGTGIPSNAVITNITGSTVTLSVAATSGSGTSTTLTPRASVIGFVSGTSPNRTYVVQWTRVTRYGHSGEDDVTYQIRLNEAAGNRAAQTLQVVYGACSTSSTSNGDAVQVGIRSTTSDFDSRTTTTDWANTTAGAANTDRCRFKSSVTPSTGRTFTWTPGYCNGAVTAGSISGTSTLCSGSGTTLTLSGQSTAAYGLSTAWSYSTVNGGPYTIAAGTGTSISTGNLNATRYYVATTTCANGGSSATTAQFAVNVNPPPTAANAGPDQTVCSSVASTTMAANTITVGSGSWTQVSGTAATITNASSPTTTITGLTTAGARTFRWTSSNSPCSNSTNDVVITVTAPPTTSNAGPDQAICSSSGVATMAANNPSVGSGTWTQTSGPSASITTPGSRTTTITGMTNAGTYTFRWTISNGPCSASTDEMSIVVTAAPVVSAGTYGPLCINETAIALNGAPTGGTWSGAGVTGNTFNPATAGAGTFTLSYSYITGPCTVQSTTAITVKPLPAVTVSALPSSICTNGASTLTATVTSPVSFSSTANSGALSVNLPAFSTSLVTRTLAISGGNGNIGSDNTISVNLSATTGSAANNNLDFYLIGPSNCGVMELSTDNGGTGDNYAGVLLRTPSAFSSIGTLGNVSNISGNFSPEGDINTVPNPASGLFGGSYSLPATPLAGCPVNGTWTIAIGNDNFSSSATFTGWSLTVEKTIAGNYSHAFSGSGSLSAVGYEGANDALGSVQLTAPPSGTHSYTILTTSPITGCTASNSVNVTVTSAPVAGTNGAITLCSNDSPVNLFDLLGGSPDPSGSWSGPSLVTGGMYAPLTMNPGVYTYTVNGTSPCGNATASVAVTENAATLWYADTDGDGFGDAGASQTACAQPLGYVANNTDLCPNDGNKQAPGQCGCGNVDIDTDGDATADCIDGCPNDPNKSAPGACGCGVADAAMVWYADADNDGLGDPNNAMAGYTCVQPSGFVADNTDLCPNTPGTVGSTCNDGNPFTNGDAIQNDCSCAGVPVACDDWSLTLRTDGAGSETTWQMVDASSPFVLASGGPYADNSTINESICVPQGACFNLVVNDAGGNGMAGGGWKLTDNHGKTILDNEGNGGAFTSTAATAAPFCNETAGDQTLIENHCDRINWLPNDVIITRADPTVSAQWGIGDQTDDGYQFWFQNPVGGYSRRMFRNHATSGGNGPANAIRATKLALSSITTNPLPTAALLNVRVRRSVNGVYGPWGPVCRFMIDPNACTLTKLNDQVNHPHTSCGASDKVVNAGGNTGKLFANVVTSGGNLATHYRFELSQPNEGYVRYATSNTAALVLGQWVSNPLLCGTWTYTVRVQASFDGGNSFCPFGEACAVGITNNLAGQQCTTVNESVQGGDHRSLRSGSFDMMVYPNPNHDGRLFLAMNGIDETVVSAGLEVFDAVGMRVMQRTVPVQEGRLNTSVELGSELPSGLYMMQVTIGDRVNTERFLLER